MFVGAELKRDKEHVVLIDSLSSLTNIMREKLLTTPFEQQEKKSYLADVITREKKTNATKEKLELKYNAAVKAKEDEVGITSNHLHIQSVLCAARQEGDRCWQATVESLAAERVEK